MCVPPQTSIQMRRGYTKGVSDVNMGGCPREIQAVTICEVEWCDDFPRGDGKAQEACQKECFAVRQALDSCAKRHVVNYFERFGLEDNGTIKLQ